MTRVSIHTCVEKTVESEHSVLVAGKPRGRLGAGRGGRPLDPAVTQRLISAALDVLAEEGFTRLTADALAVRAGAGKAAVYRRWPSIPALLEQALPQLALIDTPTDQGSLRADLFALLRPWTKTVANRDHRAAAALFSAAHVHPEVHRALQTAVVVPLHESMGALIGRGRTRGEHLTRARGVLACKLVEAMWWERGISFAEPLSPSELWSLIDSALLPPGLDGCAP